MGAEGRGLCTAAGTGRGGGSSPALRVAACSTAVSTGLRAPPGPPGAGKVRRVLCRAWGSLLGGSAPRRAGTGTRRARWPPYAPVLPAATLRFWPRLLGLPARSGVSGAAVPPIGHGNGAPAGASPAERSARPGAAQRGVGSGAEPRPLPRHRSERVPADPLPAPRPACSALLRCRGILWENACPLGKRNVCKMFAIN